MATQRKIDYEALVKPDRVHSSVYTDPEIFAEELDAIFHRGWVYVGHAGEIPHPGDYRLKRIGRYPIIMTRGDDGQIRLLLNRCRHRGATVCQTECGNAATFRCAYHAWTYRNTGELIGVTYEDGYGGALRREELGLTPVPRVDEYRGFIFGSLSPAGITLADHLGKVTEQIDLFVDLSPAGEIEVQAGSSKSNYPGNWKLQIENTIDGYHPNFSHETFFETIRDRTGARVDVFTGNSIGETRDMGGGHVMLDYRRYNRQFLSQTHSTPLRVRQSATGTMPSSSAQDYRASIVARYGEERAAEILNAGGTHTLVFPNLALLGVQIRVIYPIAVDQTEVVLHPTTLKGAADKLNQARLRAHEDFYGPAGFGQPDDGELFARVQTGIQADLDPWMLLMRGLHRERRDADGTLVGQMTDEVPQRGIWAQWKKIMTQARAADETATASRPRNGAARNISGARGAR